MIAVILAAHGASLIGEFVYDDRFIIVSNPHVRDPGEWTALLTEGTWAGAGHASSNYRPLPMLTFALQRSLWGLEPIAFRAVNLVLHLLTAGLLFGLARRLGVSTGGAWAAAAIFGAHPLVSEPVCEAVGRMDLLAGAGVMGAMVAHFRARAAEGKGERAIGWHAVSVSAFAVALFSKESAIVLPVIVLVIDVIGRELASPRRLIPYVAYAATAAGYLVARGQALGGLVQPVEISRLDNPLAHVSGLERMVSALGVTGAYLGDVVIPHHLSPDYSLQEILPLGSAVNVHAIIIWLVTAFLVALVIMAVRRSRVAAVALALSTLTFLPVSNLLFPIGTVRGDRLFYLPLAGLAILVGLGVERLIARNRGFAGVAVGAALLVLGALSVQQDRYWRNDDVLSEWAVRAAPQSARNRNNLGQVYLERDDLPAAAAQFEEALRLYPEYYLPTAGLAKVALREGDYPAALTHAAAAARRRPNEVEPLALEGEAYRRLGDTDRARRAWTALLEIEPENASALSNLAILAWNEGDRDGALALWERAVVLPGTPVETRLNLARAYEMEGRTEEAVRTYRQALTATDVTDRVAAEIRARLRELTATPR